MVAIVGVRDVFAFEVVVALVIAFAACVVVVGTRCGVLSVVLV